MQGRPRCALLRAARARAGARGGRRGLGPQWGSAAEERQRFSEAFRGDSVAKIGELALEVEGDEIVCDLVINEAWRGVIQHRYFPAGQPEAA